MSRELSGNQRRLPAIGALGVFWAALLAAVGVSVLVAAGLVAAFSWWRCSGSKDGAWRGGPAPGRGAAGVGISAAGRWAGAGVAGASRAVSARVRSVDWAGLRARARRRRGRDRAGRPPRRGRRAAAAAAAGSRRAVAAGAAAAATLEAQAREIRLPQLARPQGRHEALKLNERAAAARQRGDDAARRSRSASRLSRSSARSGERHGEALTLNGIGLTQARRAGRGRSGRLLRGGGGES